MKRILLIIIIFLAIAVGFLLAKNYILDQKLIENFLERLESGDEFDGHPQQRLISELRDLGYTKRMEEIKDKLTIHGGKRIMGINEGGYLFTFTLKTQRDQSNNKIVIIEGIDIKSGYLLDVSKTERGFKYLLQDREDEKELFHSPLNLPLKENEIVKLLLVGEEVMGYIPLEKVPLSKLLYYDNQRVTGELEGTFTLGQDVMRFGVEKNLYVGQKNLDLYLRNDKVLGIVTREKFIPDTMRVLISDSGHNNFFHREILLSSDGQVKLYSKLEGKAITIPANQKVKINLIEGKIAIDNGENMYFFQERVYLESTGFFYLHSIKRGWNNSLNPGYRGTIELFVDDEKIYLVNELSLEEYLYGVIPSEMPVHFGLDALKVQAIAARTYGVNNIYRSTYRKYSAHVVDSVLSQVYNNTLEHPEANKGVDETFGQVITYNDRVIDAKFFSTSSGYTANSHEVWDSGGEFPGKKIPYLTSSHQGVLVKYNLDTEEGFKDFISNKNVKSYDSDSPFYRWEIKMTNEQLTKSIEENLISRFLVQPQWILTYVDGQYISKEIPPKPLGRLKELKVVERGEGGNIMVLDIIGENGTYRVIKELNIRFVLRPICRQNPVKILRHDGTILSNYNILPSAFVYFQQEFKGDRLENITILGGGNGHGVGMSQYGVLGMIKRGYSLEEIVAHYYPGTEIKKIY